jgi:DNA-binding MarR family transcriptional regulator
MLTMTTSPKGSLKVEDVGWSQKIIGALDEFRKINQNITANQIITFLNIALHEGLSQTELEERTGLHNATVSRICAILSDRGLKARNQEAMDLIRITPAEDDYRSRAQVLSNKGRMVFNGLRSIMRGK